MKEIGGYFNLELCDRGGFLHDDGILLNSCRNALEFILLTLNPYRIWLPKYTCDSVFQPVHHLNIDYKFYTIDNELEIVDANLVEGDVLLYTNYFGIKDSYVKLLAEKYGKQLIVDNAQSFYSDRIPSIATIYSPRKFFGVPDGGVAYVDNPIHLNLKQDKSYDRCRHLLRRYDELASEGYSDFRVNDEYLDDREILSMSELTKAILRGIDYVEIKEKRIRNFMCLHKKLQISNKLNINIDNILCPMVYPYLTENGAELRKRLISEHIYVATYWSNVLENCINNDFEFNLAENMLALPIDQRNINADMNIILDIINKNIYG